MNYSDFDVLFERAGGKRYKALVLNSPAGQAAVDFRRPFSELELENFLLKIGRPRRTGRRGDSPLMQNVKTFGQRLFETVFDGEVRGCFRSSLDEATRQEAGLRLRLRMTNTPELADLPWEYLYNPALNHFLATSKATPVVRYLDLPERIRPLRVKPPLKVLTMISSPKDYAALAVEKEWTKLNQALDDLKRRNLVALERLDNATLEALQKRLRQNEYHIFHFIGHGEFDKHNRDGVLIFEDDNEKGVALPGQNLGTLLHDARTLRLVLLNACEGARGSRSDPFSGTAQSLVQQGIPAVIAMQFEISDDAAIIFAQEFYAAIADGHPIDMALSETRQTILVKGNEIEWAAPVLYMRAPDGRIFDLAEKPPPPPDNDGFAQLYQAQVRLSLLFYLNDTSRMHEGLSIADIREKLGIEKRKDVFAALEELAKQQFIDKIRKGKKVSWRISERGRGVLQKLSELIKTRIETLAR